MTYFEALTCLVLTRFQDHEYHLDYGLDLDLDQDLDIDIDLDLDLDLLGNYLFWALCLSDLDSFHQIFRKLSLSAKDNYHDLHLHLHLDFDLDLDHAHDLYI